MMPALPRGPPPVPPEWYNIIQYIEIDDKPALEASIEADMIYIINQSRLIDDRCKIPLFESRIGGQIRQSDSQKFGLKHNPDGKKSMIYDLGDFSTKFKSDPSGMADIIQQILDYKNNDYKYDSYTHELTGINNDGINIPDDKVFINPNNINIKNNCNEQVQDDEVDYLVNL